KKKRRNIRRLTPNVPRTAAITKRRRRATVLDSSGSSVFEKIDRSACTSEGLGAGCWPVAPGGSNVEFAILSPWPDRASRCPSEFNKEQPRKRSPNADRADIRLFRTTPDYWE